MTGTAMIGLLIIGVGTGLYRGTMIENLGLYMIIIGILVVTEYIK